MDTKDFTKVQKDRADKLAKLRAEGFKFPNDFKKIDLLGDVTAEFNSKTKDELITQKVGIQTAGRIVLKRVMGKVAFMTLEDQSGRIQVYFSNDNLGDQYTAIKEFDLGDIVGVSGQLFRTKTDELTIEVEKFQLLTKSLNPMPEKHAGLTDIETIYRKRHVDLMSNPEARETFIKRTKIVESIRNNMQSESFLEVETPMMHPIPGGANARPFKTHHNTLDKELYLRIAPELYLKRLLVGGFEKVFEINRNFRNEGISTIHNPEFTMLEFYEAYGTLEKTTKLVQKIVQDAVGAVNDNLNITYQDKELNLEDNFQIKSLKELVEVKLNVKIKTNDDIFAVAKNTKTKIEKDWSWGKVLLELFEQHVESELWQPTFVKDYPSSVSPLSRRKDDEPEYSDRIELFIAGREFANFFCELNDPEDQEASFKDQVAQKDSGDNEAMFFDEDYIDALKYGMPPAVGVGIGIDRLVMLATNKSSIKDVIIFPILK
tara:strand:- start:171 stop:1634 length:1464 start_codon:yes stop_codon:yes gene_type:complete